MTTEHIALILKTLPHLESSYPTLCRLIRELMAERINLIEELQGCAHILKRLHDHERKDDPVPAVLAELSLADALLKQVKD